jgi:hypothetical protein
MSHRDNVRIHICYSQDMLGSIHQDTSFGLDIDLVVSMEEEPE